MKNKRILSLLLIVVLLLCSCSGVKVTKEVQAAIDLYIEAVSNTEKSTSGNVKVTSIADDQAVEFKKSESIIDYKYEIVDQKVIFSRTDYLDGKENAKYTSDGEKVLSYDYSAGEWKDATEQHADYLNPKKNPLITLSLFRVDSKHKVRTDYMSDIKSYAEGNLTVVEFTLKNKTVSEIMSYNKADGVVRQSEEHIRKYYIDENKKIVKAVVFTKQKFISNGKEGFYTSEICAQIS